ncbi:MAG: creatininase family protein [Candidatus Aerophobetes bacterium]|nr:creatininase family protein [Candidatus Aerophobetes bacterium]
MPKKNLLFELSWLEIKELTKRVQTIIMPIGSVEEEGPHLPVGVDSIISSEIAKRIAENTNTLVAPLMPLGYSDWHMGFTGTITLSFDTLLQMLRDVLASLIKNGFKKFMFLNAHDGNDAAIRFTAHEMRKKHSVLVSAINLWRLSKDMIKDIPEIEEKDFLHGGEIMTSVMLALRPDLVDMNKAQTEYAYVNSGSSNFIQKDSDVVQFKDYCMNVFRLSHEVTKSGVMGNPMKATREKGEKIVDKWVSYLSESVKEFKKISVKIL